MATKEGGGLFFKVFLGGAIVIILATVIFFEFENIVTWMTLNDPFGRQWVAVQLSDGEILYGHLSGVNDATIGLSDVYILDKLTPEPSPADTVSSSTNLSITGTTTPASTTQPLLIPVSDTPWLFINRAAVLYFKYVTPDDPALPYLH